MALKMRITLFLLAMLTSILPAVPLLAIDDPHSPPQVNAVYVYEFNDGSTGVLIDYYLDYSAPFPNETATEAYMAIFIDTDGATQLKTTAPYTFVANGYRRGLIWIKFTAAETVAFGLDSANQTNYEVWLVGNPTLAWAGDPPKTIAGIDQWNTTGDMSVLLALRVLYYADVLEQVWSLNLIESTGAGNRLATLGESYFVNVIPGLRTLAPAVFASVETTPALIPLDYSTAFSAIASNGTATIVGSPVTLAEGANTIDTGATTGTILITLSQWTTGNITDGTGTLTTSPADLGPGVNTLTVTGAGTFTVSVTSISSITLADTAVTGTGFDLTGLATAFGTTRWMMSGLVWIAITILVCAALLRSYNREGFGVSVGQSEGLLLALTIMVIGGWLLGMIHPVVIAVLVILIGGSMGYFLFFKSETLHKGFMFMVWMFFIVSLSGNMAAGGITNITSTYLTADVSTTETGAISVASTTGFPASGVIVIDGEHIGYPSRNETTFRSITIGFGLITTNSILRGIQGTADNVTHTTGAVVRTVEGSIFNSAIDYKIATITDSAGTLGFLSFPANLLNLIVTFFTLPLGFLGTELYILTYIWAIVSIGMIVGFVLQLAGGRRV